MDGTEHDEAKADCAMCWPGYPRPHECGGLMHAQHFEEMEDGFILVTQCDKCGECE